MEVSDISSTAARNGPSFVLDGLLKPLIFLTNWSDAARISSSVTGGSKLKRIFIFLHILYDLKILEHPRAVKAAVSRFILNQPAFWVNTKPEGREIYCGNPSRRIKSA